MFRWLNDFILQNILPDHIVEIAGDSLLFDLPEDNVVKKIGS